MDYYQFVTEARLKGQYEPLTDWPILGIETYLKTIYNQIDYRCVILTKGTYKECEEMLGVALVRTLKDGSKLKVHISCMNELNSPFRVKIIAIQKII